MATSESPGNTATVIHKLKHFGRDSNLLYLGLIGLVREALLLSSLGEPTLVEITAGGKPGILIATLLRYIYGQVPRLSDTIPLLDILAKTWSVEPHKPQWKQLTRVWKMLRESVILEDKSSANDYLAALDCALIEGRVWKLAIARDMLEIRGELLNNQTSIIFGEYSNHASFLHDVLFKHLCAWLSNEFNVQTQHARVATSEHAITGLNEAHWIHNSGEHPNPWANLLVPAIVWAYGNTHSEAAEAVFLRGIRSIFEGIPNSHELPRTNLTGLFAQLEPILAKASPDIVKSLINRRSESLELSVSVFSRMIQAFHVDH